jgi:hypothetical protein
MADGSRMTNDTRLAPATPLAFMQAAARALMAVLAATDAGASGAQDIAQLDRAISAALDVGSDEAALEPRVAEIERCLRGLNSRAHAAGIPITTCLQAMLPEPTAIALKLSPASLMLIGMTWLRAGIETGPLPPRRVSQLQALVKAETALRRLVEAEARRTSIAPAWGASADAAAWAVEDAIGDDLEAIFAEPRRVGRAATISMSS